MINGTSRRHLSGDTSNENVGSLDKRHPEPWGFYSPFGVCWFLIQSAKNTPISVWLVGLRIVKDLQGTPVDLSTFCTVDGEGWNSSALLPQRQWLSLGAPPGLAPSKPSPLPVTRLQVILVGLLFKKCTRSPIWLLQNVYIKLEKLTNLFQMPCNSTRTSERSESCRKEPVNARDCSGCVPDTVLGLGFGAGALHA